MTDQAKLDAFLLRAGFTYGWRELESQARSMAEQAVEELDTSAERLADLQENADLKDVHWQQVCTAFGFAGHADPEELIAKAAQLTEAEASRQRMMDNAAAFAEALGERRAENEALAARLAEAERRCEWMLHNGGLWCDEWPKEWIPKMHGPLIPWLSKRIDTALTDSASEQESVTP